jgi:hypothetical protein
VAAAVIWPAGRAHAMRGALLAALTAFALLCHISTLTLLPVVLVAMAALYWWKGGAELRAQAVSIVAALAIASIFSVAVYYGHFGEAYRSAARVRAAPAISVESPFPHGAPPEGASVSLAAKSSEAARLSLAAIGWPIFLLGIPGAAWLWRRGPRDRLTWAIIAWLATYAVFVTGVVLSPVERSFQRYAAEFISRVTLATHPAAVVLAGAGAAWCWRAGPFWRSVALLLVAGAVYLGADAWLGWLR